MTHLAAVREIVAVYERNQWILRRFALRGETRRQLEPAISEAYPTIPIADSATDAAWFSRRPDPGSAVWEIRHLGETPYALLTGLDDSQDGFEDTLREFELKLEAALESRRTS